MAHIPDEIPIKGMKRLRNGLLAAGGFSGFIAYGFAQNGNGKGFLICAGASAAMIYVATQLKTTRKLVSKGGMYR